jgi:hypothetical protein
MYIWNKVLVGLISFASLFLFFMGAWALKMETGWSRNAQNLGDQVKQLKKDNDALADQTGQLKMDLYKLTLDRRRMWPLPISIGTPGAQCDAVVKTGPETAEVSITISQTSAKSEPIPHGIVPGLVLYAFEQTPVESKGQYLGEFKVTKVNGKLIALAPTSRLSPREVAKVAKANRRPWMLYEVMPADSHEALASLSDAEKKAMLSPESVQEYLKDGKPAEKDDPRDRVVKDKYVRPLQDYSILFGDERQKRLLLAASTEVLQEDNQLVQEALTDARAQANACAKDIASTKAEKEAMERDRDVVKTHHQKLEKSLGAMQAWVARLIELNQALAGRIAKFQLEAAQKIDQRTRAMAQSGAGRL